MLNPIHTSRFLLAALMAYLAWFGLAEIGPDANREHQNVSPMAHGANVVSRGGPRPLSDAVRGGDVLVARKLMLTPSPTPRPPTPVPTSVPQATIGSLDPEPNMRSLGTFRVTAYSDSVRNGTEGHGITKSGEKTRWGVVAVDPAVIPLHSRLLIEGMGETVFTALDTGGGIVGRWVDVWYATDGEALQHGVMESHVFLMLN